jgi:type VI secretion system secreted protein Hcp
MAESVALFLKSNGKDVQGENTQKSLGRDGSIECVYVEHECATAREASSGTATGRRVYQPIVIRKRIDKSTPLIAEAMVKNKKIDGKFLFFRPNPAGDGTTQQFYTIEISNGRVASMKQFIHPTNEPDMLNEAPLEEWTFTFSDITWTWVDGGVSTPDSWSNNG